MGISIPNIVAETLGFLCMFGMLGILEDFANLAFTEGLWNFHLIVAETLGNLGMWGICGNSKKYSFFGNLAFMNMFLDSWETRQT